MHCKAIDIIKEAREKYYGTQFSEHEAKWEKQFTRDKKDFSEKTWKLI